LALLDRLGSLFGRPPIYIPGHGSPGDLSIGATPDGPFGEKLMTPKDGTRWHDRVAARSLLSFSWRRPVRRAASVRVPFLLVVPEADTIAPVPTALEVARTAPGAELFRNAGGHYDVYEGGAGFADVLRTEIDFLHRHAKTAAQKGVLKASPGRGRAESQHRDGPASLRLAGRGSSPQRSLRESQVMISREGPIYTAPSTIQVVRAGSILRLSFTAMRSSCWVLTHSR
jgi:hypothetical protein